MTNNKLKVALLLGGDSSERRVSFMSGRAVAGALSRDKFEVAIFDVAQPATRESFDGTAMLSREAFDTVDWEHLVGALMGGGFDVVLPMLHSGRGEDGTLQALLEVAGLPFVGSPMHASALAMDKAACKAVLRDYGVPSPQGRVLHGADELDGDALFSSPCVVKPRDSGSSVGVTIFAQAPEREALRQAVDEAAQDGAALVEELISGVEVTVATMGEGQSARSLPVIEIVPQTSGGWYDFEAKYAPGGSQHLIPPRLSEDVQRQIEGYALTAHRALGCRGVARSDFIVSPNGTPYFLEINTLPGMTETSLVPDAARAAGLPFDALLEQLINEAIAD